VDSGVEHKLDFEMVTIDFKDPGPSGRVVAAVRQLTTRKSFSSRRILMQWWLRFMKEKHGWGDPLRPEGNPTLTYMASDFEINVCEGVR
jgi:hypothetical protein